ncbi:hypothetical protein L195_g054585, partial [Trifolium pratense]
EMNRSSFKVIILINEHNNLGGSCSGPSIYARTPEDVEQIRPEQAYYEEPARLARLSNGLILLRIITVVNRNDEHLLHIKASSRFPAAT